MLTTVADALAQVRGLADDPKGQFTKLETVIPIMQFAADLFAEEVAKNPNLGILASVIELPNVALGTRSLASYFASGQPLYTLTGIIDMKERAVTGSRSEQDWIQMDPTIDVPTILQGAFNLYYSFRGDDIQLPGADQALDFRIFGKFVQSKLKDEKSVLVPNTSPVVAARTAAIICGNRGNARMEDRNMTLADRAQSAFVTNAIMEIQALKTRMRSFSGRNLSAR